MGASGVLGRAEKRSLALLTISRAAPSATMWRSVFARASDSDSGLLVDEGVVRLSIHESFLLSSARPRSWRVDEIGGPKKSPIVLIRHLWTLYSVNKILFDTI